MTIIRLSVLPFVLALVGCTYQPPAANPVVPESYPIRQDFLVRSLPKAIPSGWFKSGEPPLLMLRNPPDTWGPDTRELAKELGNGIIPATKLEPDYRSPLAESLTKLFGTPASPKVAAVSSTVEEVIRELRLDAETLALGADVYRRNCIDCHGLTGDGNGPGGKWLVPLPRDYRQGIFKFISSDEPRSAESTVERCGPKPRRDDLKRTIIHGIDAGSMPSFAMLPEREIDALVSYVTHLSIRGECEFTAMLSFIRDESDFDEIGDEVEATLKVVAMKWLRAERTPVVVPVDPALTEEEWLESASNGFAIFHTVGGCVACHRDYGRDGAFQYDPWGGVVRARNLTLGMFRGGRSGEALYTRLYTGIGANMPPHHQSLKSTPEELAAGRNKLWDVVHFVQSLSDSARKSELRRRFGIVID